MKRDLLEYLVCPETGQELELKVFAEEEGEITEGLLTTASDLWYPIIDGVPRLLVGDLRADWSDFLRRHDCAELADESCAQVKAPQTQHATRETFSDKWSRFRDFAVNDKDQAAFYDQWFSQKLGLETLEELYEFISGRKTILEVGPGSGQKLLSMASHTDGVCIGVDLSEAAVSTHHNVKHLPNAHAIQADVFRLPIRDGVFDFAVSDGVIHHTPDPFRALESMARVLAHDGMVAIHVYRKMGALREFSDDWLRDKLSRLSPEDCYKVCEPITELGRILSGIDAEVTLDRPIPEVGFPAGTYPVQRFFHYFVMKCFWNDLFSFEENNMVNFDWYHPADASRHTEEEVLEWFQRLGLTLAAVHPSNPNGVSATAVKP